MTGNSTFSILLLQAEKEEQAAKEVAAPAPVKLETDYGAAVATQDWMAATAAPEAENWGEETPAAVVPGAVVPPVAAAPGVEAPAPAFPATQDWANTVRNKLISLLRICK